MFTNKYYAIPLVAVLLLIASFSGLLFGDPKPQVQAPEEGIVFVDLSKVINNYDGMLKMQKELKAFTDEGNVQLKLAKEEIDKINNEISVYSPSSAEFIQGSNQIEIKQLALKQLKRNLVMQQEMKLNETLISAYEKIEKAVADYASRKGYKGVMTRNRLDFRNMQNLRPDEVMRMISMVNVVWNDDQLDISDAIITIINGS